MRRFAKRRSRDRSPFLVGQFVGGRGSPALLLGILSSACSGPAVDSEVGSAQTEGQRVLAAEDAYVAAELAADEGALRQIVDDRFVMNSPDGTTTGKDDLIRSVLGMHMTNQTISERSVVVEGNMAIIFGTTELELEPPGGAPQKATFRYTSAYVKRGGEWRMLALHMVPRSPRP